MMRSKKSLAVMVILVLATIMGGGYIHRVYRPRVLVTGTFHQVAHKSEGVATISQLPDGKCVLRLTRFRTVDMPGLDILLISAPDALENETVRQSEVFALGSLKKANGDQEYMLPPGLDLTRYHAVTIWNRKYEVNFTTAPLRKP